MSHKMNPFDFVAFATEQPLILKPDEWFEKGRALTGYLELQLQAKTPLHIVGNQDGERVRPQIIRSHFYRRHNQPIIPASSIRGVLRAFIEAACNCWASQLTPFYEKKFGGHSPHNDPNGRHIGFRVLKDETVASQPPDPQRIDAGLLQALPEHIFPKPDDIGKLDLASFIFGHVPPAGEKEKNEGWRGCVKIEDANINEPFLNWHDQQGNEFKIPDIQSDAFMGRPWPNASSWWYMFARGIQKRNYEDRNGRIRQTTEFIGQGLRGRKFYYHQSPIDCVNWYRNNWPRDPNRPMLPFPVECLPAGEKSEPFRIYFEELPEPLLDLLILAISPGDRIRHKLGYGKAYGYGSIELAFCGGIIRSVNTGVKAIPERSDRIRQALWDKEKLKTIGIEKFLNWTSLMKLNQILWFDETSNLIFAYPTFQPDGFRSPIEPEDMEGILNEDEWEDFDAGQRVLFSQRRGQEIAQKIFARKKTLNFRVWQEKAEGFNIILKRKL